MRLPSWTWRHHGDRGEGTELAVREWKGDEMMRIAPLADTKARLSGYLKRVPTDGPVIITRNGRPVALLLAPRDEDDLERLVLADSSRFQALLAKSRASIEAGQGFTRHAFWKAVAEHHKRRERTQPTSLFSSRGWLSRRCKEPRPR